MSRPATSRLKVNAPLGRMPVLQFMAPGELQVDVSYQRSLEAGPSQTLIRKIAQFWNWDLCQPLVVARRSGGDLFVIDGQHRLEAARLRGDIAQLPCVVVDYASAADEAASFVHLNQQRRPLTKLDVFKAAVASEDPEACAILAALEEAGLSIAPHSNYTAWKPGMVANIGGIGASWRAYGEAATRYALAVLQQAFSGQVLRYAGTIFAGIAAVCFDEIDKRHGQKRSDELVAMIGAQPQAGWRSAIMQKWTDEPNLKFARAAAAVLREAWAQRFGDPPAPVVTPITTRPLDPSLFTRTAKDEVKSPPHAWCEQCDMRVTFVEAEGCRSRFCSLRKRA